jgi:hypothetical protein
VDREATKRFFVLIGTSREGGKRQNIRQNPQGPQRARRFKAGFWWIKSPAPGIEMKTLRYILMVVLVSNAIPVGRVMAQQSLQANDLKHTKEIKKVVSKTGASLDKEVTVKLRDKTVLAGVISEIADDHFTLKANSGAPYSIRYDEVDKLNVHKLNGRGFTTAPSVYKKVIAGFAIGIGVIAIACIASRRCAD